jgi:ATP-binding cassette, subfamily A (ABC1), member 3
MTVYGGPILYLTLQSFFLLGLLLLWDSGLLAGGLQAKFRRRDVEEKHSTEEEVSNELARVKSSQDGLRVLHLTKQFKDNLAVDDVTFGVPRGEVFALLGPNGAGKSTIISLIRGDIKPSGHGEVLVENVSVTKHRAQARSYLGVCPQFDAMDTMTVSEHLNFYARIRGVEDPRHNAQEVMRAVGLQSYASRMAAKLSGGNKRKLSLGIALMGNPTVLLLDEPSSGMDAASKRVMWRTLASVVPGRSLVLTTQ